MTSDDSTVSVELTREELYILCDSLAQHKATVERLHRPSRARRTDRNFRLLEIGKLWAKLITVRQEKNWP